MEKPKLKLKNESPVQKTEVDFNQTKPRLESNSSRALEVLINGEKISFQKYNELRLFGGDYEYTKVKGENTETRKDVACGSYEETFVVISQLLADYHSMLKGLEIEPITWTANLERRRFPKHGLDLQPTMETPRHQKYKIIFLGQEIGEIMNHSFGHRDGLTKFGDKNATLPHINFNIYNFPNKGLFKSHLTFDKN